SPVLISELESNYKSLNKELYLFDEAKSFNDLNSTLYKCVDYLEKHPYTNVITYNYDTNLEYLLKKRGIKYTSVYDENSFVNKEALTTIFHVHGLLPYDKYKESKYINSLIFNESEYFYLYNNPYSWNISKQMHDFTFNTCLFIGVSLTDPNMKRLLEASANPLKFNFIFMKKEEGFKESTYRSVTNYFFSYDLITIWIDKYEEIGLWLSLI
ncbi:MAG: SIR2 family protein, partial [Candidatus Onthovivens sp.]